MQITEAYIEIEKPYEVKLRNFGETIELYLDGVFIVFNNYNDFETFFEYLKEEVEKKGNELSKLR